MDNNYWKEKYADYHSRAESRIAELEEEKEEFRTAYNAILEQCKKEQSENEILKKVAFQSQNAAIHINQTLEKCEDRVKVLEKDLVDWQDAYKELYEEHDKFQKAYQDDHCELLKYKQKFIEIKEIVNERVNGENIKGWDYFTGITEIWHLLLELQEGEEDETKNI